MPSEQFFPHPPETVFQACVNAVAYTEWAMKRRDPSELRMRIRTPLSFSKFNRSIQDEIEVELHPEEGGTRVWVDSNPRYQLWNFGKDSSNEATFLEEVGREVTQFEDGVPDHRRQQRQRRKQRPAEDRERGEDQDEQQNRRRNHNQNQNQDDGPQRTRNPRGTQQRNAERRRRTNGHREREGADRRSEDRKRRSRDRKRRERERERERNK